MNGVKERTMGRRFKNVSVNQLEELMIKLNEKMKAGCSIDDALMYVQAYAAAEELQDIKIKRAEEQPND